MTFRQVVFWLHLIAGLVAGLAIGVMCFTGAALAFEKELIAWAERDARRVEPPTPDAARLTLDALQQRLRAAQPDARPSSIVVQNDPHAAVAFMTGRSGGFFANPYTGEIRHPKSGAMSDFMRLMTEWHRNLGFQGESSRPRAKLVNGICNLAFAVLALSGLYIWMPRSWSWRAVRPVIWFRRTATGKARDFNWHNTIGLWSAPVLLVLTLTAIPISFRWGANAIYRLTGTPIPATRGPGPAGAPGGASIEVPQPTPESKPLTQTALLAAVQKHVPRWQTITIRSGGTGGRGGRASREGAPADGRSGSAAMAMFSIREAGSWPRTATTTVGLNPYTGELLQRTGYASLDAAQRMRSWTRFLHTGEALGKLGQLVAGLACLGGCFLVYTGVALSWRRFFGGPATPRAPE